MSNTTYKDAFQLVSEEIEKRIEYRNTKTFRNQLDRSTLFPFVPNALSDIRAADLVTAVQVVLQEALPGFISSGLQVEATSPASQSIIVRAGKGSKGGQVYELLEDVTVPTPTDITTQVLIVSLFRDRIIFEKNPSLTGLQLAKIIIPQPGSNYEIYDKKDDRADVYDAYIVGFQEVKLYADRFGKLEEDSIAFLRDNIGPVLADNIIGNIRLSEDLKITNTQGTLALDSNSLKLYNNSGNVLAKFNQNGTFYYNSSGVEIARFANDSAKIGNILITKNTIQSGDYVSENKGFQIKDDGFAEFENVRIRGRLSSSVFEYDKISAVSGKLFVGNSSVISVDMTSADNSTLSVDDAVFGVGDILRIKDGINEEYMQVNSVSGTTYTVTRDLAAQYSANSNPTWSTGTAIVSTGNPNSGQTPGFIMLDAVSQYSPFIDIALRNSSTYNDWTVKARLGNLAGITDSLYGTLSGFGLYSDNVYLRGKLYAPDIKTAVSGARIELNTCCLAGYDDSNRIFNFELCGASVGDFCLGNFSGNCGILYDASAGALCVRGLLNADDLVAGSISASRIGAGCIFTCCGITIANVPQMSGATARTEFTSTGIQSYSNTGALNFQLCDGHIQAQDIKLQDPLCTCCYSCLNAGKLVFHDELGSVPYINRICAGCAPTGSWVCLRGWRVAPQVIVGVNTLSSYNAAKVAQDQSWTVYADGIQCYCNSGLDYGHCFQVHACLQLAVGQGAECVKNVNFGVATCTDAGVCSTKVRLKLELYCHAAAPANWCYGQLCYALCYRCLGCLVWCASCFLYTQPHSTANEMSTPSEATQTLTFPLSATWEIMACQVTLTWVDSGIASGATNCFLCSRDITATTGCCILLNCITGACNLCCRCCTASFCIPVTLAGTSPTPSCIFCAYICYCTCSVSTCNLKSTICWPFINPQIACLCATSSVCFGICSATGSKDIDNCSVSNEKWGTNCSYGCECNVSWIATPHCCGLAGAEITRDYTAGYICMNFMGCIQYPCLWSSTVCTLGVANVCWVAGTLHQCYCVVSGAADSCVLEQICSLCDTYGTSCVLDAAGVLNWMAIAYT